MVRGKKSLSKKSTANKRKPSHRTKLGFTELANLGRQKEDPNKHGKFGALISGFNEGFMPDFAPMQNMKDFVSGMAESYNKQQEQEQYDLYNKAIEYGKMLGNKGWEKVKNVKDAATDKFDDMYKKVSERNAQIETLIKAIRFIEEQCNLLLNKNFRSAMTNDMKKTLLGKIIYNIDGLTKNMLTLRENNIHIPSKVSAAIENIIKYGRATVNQILPEIP